jgi:N-methylhydantoinase A/oxoprolinase/acetone carboxylase beta subunit
MGLSLTIGIDVGGPFIDFIVCSGGGGTSEVLKLIIANGISEQCKQHPRAAYLRGKANVRH